MEDNNKQQQMNDEYSKEFGGCLWMLIACMMAVTVLGCIILFT